MITINLNDPAVAIIAALDACIAQTEEANAQLEQQEEDQLAIRARLSKGIPARGERKVRDLA